MPPKQQCKSPMGSVQGHLSHMFFPLLVKRRTRQTEGTTDRFTVMSAHTAGSQALQARVFNSKSRMIHETGNSLIVGATRCVSGKV